MTLITQTADLAAFCQRQSGAEFVAVDTEFMRDKTYWPQLCLVQVAGPEEAAAIDSLAPGIDLKPLYDLLTDTKIVKVFHAARQDMEVFYHLTNQLPVPIVDTQVAAMVCGFGDSVSYETLATKLASARIDKSSRFTDWARRPLSDRQLAYALSDVTHLRLAYEKLRKRIDKAGRHSWFEDEMAVLTDTKTYRADPQMMWRRLKVRSDKPRFLALLRELAAWREEEAQRRNLPRNRVIKDESLIELAAHAPRNVEDLSHGRGLGRGFAESKQGTAILAAIERGLAVPESECPKPEPRPVLPQGIGPLVELLKVLLKSKCEQHGVAQRLIASSDELDLLAADDSADIPALHGWRREVYGEDALALKAGRIGLTVAGKGIKIIPLAPAS